MTKRKYESYEEYYQNHKKRIVAYYRQHRYSNKEQYLLDHAKRRAKEKNLEFDIDLSDVIIPKFCPILGIEIVRTNSVAQDNSPSIDRIDNSKGYIKGNIWVISRMANTMKAHASKEQLITFAKSILNMYGAS